MGLLDELDDAFDNMFNPKPKPEETPASEKDPVDVAFDHLLGEEGQARPRQAGPRQAEPRLAEPEIAAEYDPIAEDVARLKAALADENLIPIQALGSVLDRCRRPYMLAALVGALAYLRGVDRNDARGRITESMMELLTTRQGTTRKLLRAPQLRELRRILAQLGPVREAELSEEMADYVTGLQNMPEISPPALTALFSAGMWRPVHLNKGSIREIALLADLDPRLVKAVKNVFKPENV